MLVARERRIILHKAYGFADRRKGTRLSRSQPLPLASVTKPLVAIGVMRLQEAGTLRTADSVCRHVPDCPAAWRPITLRNLLNMTSGLAPAPQLVGSQPRRPPTLEQAIAQLKRRPTIFAPGSEWLYVNENYLLLGYIIGRVTGRSWPRQLEESVFQPLDMDDTGYSRLLRGARTDVVGYSTWLNRQGRPRRTPRLSEVYPSGAGGLESTVRDLYALDRALLGEALLTDASKAEVFTPGPETGRAQYGYGWDIYRVQGHRVIEHDGGMPGYSTCLSRYPAERVAILVLSNLEESTACQYVARDLAAIVWGKRPPPVRPLPVRRLPARALRAYAGRYRSVGGGASSPPVTIRPRHGWLDASPLGPYPPGRGFNTHTIMRPLGPDRFVDVHAPRGSVTFRRNRNGRVVEMVEHEPAFKDVPPMKFRWRRVTPTRSEGRNAPRRRLKAAHIPP